MPALATQPKRSISQVDEKAVARQWEKLQELTEAAKTQWAQVRKETKKLARLAHLGAKKSVTVRIGETSGIEITNQFKGEDECFAPAFAKRFSAKKVKLDPPPG